MKYGTILRVARVILVLVIVLMMIIPLVGSMASINAEKMTAGIESKYELKEVNEDYLIGTSIIEANIDLIDGLGNEFYVKTNNDSDYVKFTDTRAAAEYIQTKHIDDKSEIAQIYDKDKKICMQKTIQYHDGINTKVVTGMKLPDNIMGLASFSISMRMVSEAGNYNIQLGNSTIKDGYLLIETKIPDLLMVLANSIDHKNNVKVDVTIMGVASFYVNLYFDTAAYITAEISGNDMLFTGAAIGSSRTIIGQDKNVYFGYELGIAGFDIMLRPVDPTTTQPLSQLITRDANGNIPVEYYCDSKDPTKSQTGIISGEFYDSIINILRYYEGMQHV